MTVTHNPMSATKFKSLTKREGMAGVRDPVVVDESAWRHLWHGYNLFYECQLPEAVTSHTWQRILDPTSPIFARLATANGTIVGFSAYVVHEGTWVVSPVCYLEDLFVDPQYRNLGFGRLLIKDLVDRAKLLGWSRLYWHTRSDNPARPLYDEFASADDFVRYRLFFE